MIWILITTNISKHIWKIAEKNYDLENKIYTQWTEYEIKVLYLYATDYLYQRVIKNGDNTD